MYGAIHALIRNRKKTGGTPEGETEGTPQGKTGGNTRRPDRREHPKARQPTEKITSMWMAPYTYV